MWYVGKGEDFSLILGYFILKWSSNTSLSNKRQKNNTIAYNLTSSKTPPKHTALLPMITANDRPHLGVGLAPECFTVAHFHLLG